MTAASNPARRRVVVTDRRAPDAAARVLRAMPSLSARGRWLLEAIANAQVGDALDTASTALADALDAVDRHPRQQDIGALADILEAADRHGATS